MTATLTAHPKAVVGRRVEFTFYRDLQLDDPPKHAGVITELIPEQGASVKIRLDGHRTSLHVPPDFEGLTYLEEVGPVPDLPMGSFTPTADDFGGTIHHGIPVCLIDNDDVIALTDDRDTALAALAGYCGNLGLYVASVSLDRLEGVWAVFEWLPEDADGPWSVRWPAEGDDHAIRIHYLPA